MVRIKTCRLTRNPQLGDPVAWLNLTLADGREFDDVALHRSPGGRWFFQGWGWLSADRRPTAGTQHCRREPLFMSSRPEDSHLRALPDPYVNLSIHTAPDVRPFPWQSCQWAKSVGFARRSRSNQSRAPLVLRRNRLNLRRAQRMT